MGLNLLTAMEVANQYHDLYISVGKSDSTGKFAFLISRGPGHNFKPLLSTNAAFENAGEAIVAVGNILNFVCQIIKKEIVEKTDGGWTADITNPGNRPIEELDILNDQKVEQILVALRAKGVANTWELFPEVSAAAT